MLQRQRNQKQHENSAKSAECNGDARTRAVAYSLCCAQALCESTTQGLRTNERPILGINRGYVRIRREPSDER
jgi:hypothetical protein